MNVPANLLDPCERYVSITAKPVEPSCITCSLNYKQMACPTLSERFCAILGVVVTQRKPDPQRKAVNMTKLWEAIKPSFIRAVRTFVQVAIGVYLAGLTTSPMLGDLATWDLIQAAIASGIVAVLWNLLEELGGAKYPRG